MFRTTRIFSKRLFIALTLVTVSLVTVGAASAQQPATAPPAEPATPPVPAAQPAPKPAAGGGYQVVPILPELLGETVDAKRLLTQYQSNFQRVFSGVNSIDDPAVKDSLDKYCKFYYFARLTHPENLGDWATERQRFFKQLSNTKLAPVHDYFVNLTFTVMKVIVTGNYHPVAKYNAMVFIAELNEIEASLIGDQKRQPKPYLPALTFMWDEYEKPNQLDAVKLACLVGIMRHAKIDRQNTSGRLLVGTRGAQRLTDMMVKTINQKEPPQGRTPEGNDWFRRRAIEILATVGAVGDNEIVVTTLRDVLNDEEASIKLRCTAVEALGKLDYPANVTFKPAELAKEMAAVAVVAARTESRRLQEVVEKEAQESLQGSSGYGGDYGMYGGGEYGSDYSSEEEYGSDYGSGYGSYGSDYGSYGSGYGSATTTKPFDPAAYRIIRSRRTLKWQLSMIRTGLGSAVVPAAEPTTANPDPQPTPATGMLALAKTPADQTEIKNVITYLDGIIGVADDHEHEDLGTLAGEIGNKVVELEDNCGIVVQVPGAEEDALNNVDDLLGGDLGDAMDALDGGGLSDGLDALQGPAAPPAAGNGGPAAPPAPGNGGPAAPPAAGNGGPAAPPAAGP